MSDLEKEELKKENDFYTAKEFWEFRQTIMGIVESTGKNGEYYVLSFAEAEATSENEILEEEIYIEAFYKDYSVSFEVFRNKLEVEYYENGEYEVLDCEREVLHEFTLSDEAVKQIPTGYNAIHNMSLWQNVDILEKELYENLKDFLPKSVCFAVSNNEIAESLKQQTKQSNSITQAEMEAIKKEVNQIGNEILKSNNEKSIKKDTRWTIE